MGRRRTGWTKVKGDKGTKTKQVDKCHAVTLRWMLSRNPSAASYQTHVASLRFVWVCAQTHESTWHLCSISSLAFYSQLHPERGATGRTALPWEHDGRAKENDEFMPLLSFYNSKEGPWFIVIHRLDSYFLFYTNMWEEEFKTCSGRNTLQSATERNRHTHGEQMFFGRNVAVAEAALMRLVEESSAPSDYMYSVLLTHKTVQ